MFLLSASVHSTTTVSPLTASVEGRVRALLHSSVSSQKLTITRATASLSRTYLMSHLIRTARARAMSLMKWDRESGGETRATYHADETIIAPSKGWAAIDWSGQKHTFSLESCGGSKERYV